MDFLRLNINYDLSELCGIQRSVFAAKSLYSNQLLECEMKEKNAYEKYLP